MKPMLLLPLVLAGCGTFDTGPRVDIPPQCEHQVYADATVKTMIAEGAGSDGYRLTHLNALKYAKLDAVTRCLQQQGLSPQGGGVQRQQITD